MVPNWLYKSYANSAPYIANFSHISKIEGTISPPKVTPEGYFISNSKANSDNYPRGAKRYQICWIVLKWDEKMGEMVKAVQKNWN